MTGTLRRLSILVGLFVLMSPASVSAGVFGEWVCTWDTDGSVTYDRRDFTHDEAVEACELDAQALCVCEDPDGFGDEAIDEWAAWACETEDGESFEFLKDDYEEQDEAVEACEDESGRECDCDDD